MLREITGANRPEVERLRVTSDQENYVAGVVESLRANASSLLTSVAPGPASPMGFYLCCGFARTGQVFDGEDVLELRLMT